jgi:hypothetical protein
MIESTAVKRFSLLRVLIVCVSIAMLATYLTVWPALTRNPMAKRADFIIYYCAGRVPLSKLYNIDAQREVQIGVLGSPMPVEGGMLPFNHAPLFVPLLHMLVNDDYAASYLRWTMLLWPVILGCAFLIFKMTGDLALCLVSASFYPVFISVMKGHDTVFILLGVLLCAYLLSLGKDWLAGIALSLITLKPHLAIFLAVPLIARPKAFLGFCAASTLLALYSMLLVGTGGVSDFLTLLRISAGGFGMRPLAMFNLLGLMERAGVSPETARPVAWVIFFLTTLFLLFVWKQSPANPPFALTMLLAVFTSPHLHGHDLALLLVTFVTLSRPNASFLLVSSLALGAFDIIWTDWRYIVAQLVMGALLVLSIKDARNRSTGTVVSAEASMSNGK